MTASGLPGALIRRWYVAVVGLVLTAVAGWVTAGMLHADYQTSAAVLLVPPKASTGTNPYLDLGSLGGLDSVLSQAATTSAMLDKLQSEGVTGTYTISTDPASNAPILVVTGEDRSPAGALSTVRHVVDLLPETLKTLQQSVSVPTDAMVTSSVLNPAHDVKVLHKTQIRGVIAAIALGLLATALCVAGVDNLVERRRRRSSEPDLEDAVEDDSEDVPDRYRRTEPGFDEPDDFDEPDGDFDGVARRLGHPERLPAGTRRRALKP